MMTRLTVLLALALAWDAGAADPPKRQEQISKVRVLAARYYPAAERFVNDGRRVGAKLKVVEAGSDARRSRYIYVTEDSEIVIEGIGRFRFGAMTEKQFKRLLAGSRALTVEAFDCAAGDARLSCARTLAVGPQRASNQGSASIPLPSF